MNNQHAVTEGDLKTKEARIEAIEALTEAYDKAQGIYDKVGEGCEVNELNDEAHYQEHAEGLDSVSELYGPRTIHVEALIEWMKTADWGTCVVRHDAVAAWDADAALEASVQDALAWDAAAALEASVWAALPDARSAVLLARTCVVWGVLTPEQVIAVRAWLDPVAEALGKTPEELMNMGGVE